MRRRDCANDPPYLCKQSWPFSPSHNYCYLLTVADRFIRWPEAIPLVDAQTMHAFAFNWIVRFGVPVKLTSDRGSQFTSELWTLLSQVHIIRRHKQLRTNLSLLELLNVFIVIPSPALLLCTTGNELPWFLLGVRTMTKAYMAIPKLMWCMKFNQVIS